MPNPYLHGNFAPVVEERSDDHRSPGHRRHPTRSRGPASPERAQPGRVLPVEEADYHWFSGDGMIHAISLGGSKATGYRNRWVRTRALSAKVGTAPPKGPGEPIDGPANTHVIRHAGTTLALVESGFPHALSPDLNRARVHDFDGALASPMTAHPKVDPVTGELIFFGTDVFGPPFLRYHVADASGRLVHSEEIDIPMATMIHDFGVTATRVVFLDLPVVFDLELAAAGRSIPYRWMPEAGARVGVMPRTGGNTEIRWTGIDPVYVFHVLNCFDDGDRVVIDVVRYDRAFDTAPGEPISLDTPTLARWTVDPVANRVSEQRLDDIPVEFPRIDDDVAGFPHRYGYCTRLGDRADDPGYRGLVKYDLVRDESVRFDPGAYVSPGEPVFVKAVDGRGEDEGWILSVVYDATRDASDLVILDATSFAGPPVATVHLPARVPFGFHGSWVPSS